MKSFGESAEKELSEKTCIEEDRARLAAIVESSEDAIVGKTLQGVITSWNEGAERLFGYTAEEMVGASIFKLIPPDHVEEEADILKRLQRGERVMHFETVRRHQDGHLVDISLSASPIRDGNGQIIGASKIARDVGRRRRAEAAIVKANELLREQAAELNRSQEELRALAARLHRVREEEAMRIARELHDELGRCLTMMKLDLVSMEHELSSDEADSEKVHHLKKRLGGIKEAIDETVRTVRKISSELRPGPLDDLGLAAAIEWQVQDFQKRSGLKCFLTLPDEDLQIEPERATALFRIFQESLTNVARHSRAAKVWVSLSAESEGIVLEVEDNGVGISSAEMKEGRSLGLLGMRERAAAFGGLVEIGGSPGQGTSVIVRMPLIKADYESQGVGEEGTARSFS